MVIFWRTLKKELPLALVFGLVLALTLFLVIREFSVAKDIDFSSITSQVPDSLKPLANAFLILNIFGGYLHIVASVNWIFLSSLWTCIVFSGLISKEVERGTIDILITSPISRIKILAEKFLAALLWLLVLGAFSFLGFYAGTFWSGIGVPYSVEMLFKAVVNGTAFFVGLSSVSLFFSVIFNEHKRAAIVSILFFMLSYLAFFLAGFSPLWMRIKRFTLFRFFNTEKLFMSGIFHWKNVYMLLLISIIFFLLSWIVFSKKEVRS